ncbi:MAG: hypothetical protein WCK82_16025, partial [Bacteroidota bacterium]
IKVCNTAHSMLFEVVEDRSVDKATVTAMFERGKFHDGTLDAVARRGKSVTGCFRPNSSHFSGR